MKATSCRLGENLCSVCSQSVSAGTIWERTAISLVIISTPCTGCQVPSTAQDVLDGWGPSHYSLYLLSESRLRKWDGAERRGLSVCVCDLWKGEGRESEWPEGWTGRCPGEQPALAVVKPQQEHVPAPVPSPTNAVSAGQDTWVRMLPSWDQTHATSLFRELPGFWAFPGCPCL